MDRIPAASIRSCFTNWFQNPS